MSQEFQNIWKQELEAAPNIRCDLKEGLACPAMRTYMQHGEAKGIRLIRFRSRTTGEVTCTAIVYKGSAADPGVEFNVCPWCGCGLGD